MSAADKQELYDVIAEERLTRVNAGGNVKAVSVECEKVGLIDRGNGGG